MNLWSPLSRARDWPNWSNRSCMRLESGPRHCKHDSFPHRIATPVCRSHSPSVLRWRIRRWGIPFPSKLQKDYDKLWKRFLTGKEDAKVFSGLDKLLKQSPDAASVLVVQAYIDLYAGRFVDGERRLQTVLSRSTQPTRSLRSISRSWRIRGAILCRRTTCMAVCGRQVRRWRARTRRDSGLCYWRWKRSCRTPGALRTRVG